MASGVALLAGFVLRERTATDPMVPLRLFGSRTFSAANAATFLQSGSIFTASGVNNTMGRFGGAFGVAIVTAVFTAHGSLASTAGVVAGYRPALSVSAVLSLAGSAAAVAIGRRRAVPRAASPGRRDQVPAGAAARS
jgi:hypothetical protein